jgi:hypothetical protein
MNPMGINVTEAKIDQPYFDGILPPINWETSGKKNIWRGMKQLP